MEKVQVQGLYGASGIQDLEDHRNLFFRDNIRRLLQLTVYLAPQEGRDPFVSVGSEVKKGDTVCIIESMKMLNEIPAERDGRITAVLVSNEETVEYGQGLFVIE